MSSSSTPSQPAPTFTFFNKLPEELRLMIWDHAIPGRIVALQPKRLNKTFEKWERCEDRYFGNLCWRAHEIREDGHIFHKTSQRLYGLHSRVRLPLVSFTCKESFQFATKFGRMFTTTYSKGTTYFDFKKDTLYLEPSNGIIEDIHNNPLECALSIFLRLMESIRDTANLMRVENLAIYLSVEPWCFASDHDEHHRVEQWAAHIFHRFCPRLKSFSIVIRDERVEPILRRNELSPEVALMGGVVGSVCTCGCKTIVLGNPPCGRCIKQHLIRAWFANFIADPIGLPQDVQQPAASDNESRFWPKVDISMFQRCLSTLRDASDTDLEPRPFPTFDVAIAIPKEQQGRPILSALALD